MTGQLVPCAGTILFLTSVQGIMTPGLAPSVPRARLMRSSSNGSMQTMGDVWAEIECTKRGLEENKLEILAVIAQQRRAGRPEEYDSLEEKFNDLIKRDDELRAELARLVALAVRQRMRGGA